MPTTYSYTLQTDMFAAGAVTVKLHSEYSDLVVPSFSSLWYEETNERYDAIPGMIELDEMVCRFSEDYSTYYQGFWYKVLSGYCEIQFYITADDGTQSHFFWGRVVEPAAQLEELSYIAGDFERQGELRLVSLLIKAKEVNPYTAMSEIENHLLELGNPPPSPSGNNEYHYYHTIKCLFASILSVTFGQTYDENDVLIPQIDLKFYNRFSSSEIIDLDMIYLYYGEGSGGGPGFVNRDGFQWDFQFKSCYEVLMRAAESFFWVVRHTYSTSTSRHQFQLLTRGRSYSASTYDVPISSVAIRLAYPPMLAMTSAREPGGNDKRYVFSSATPTYVIGATPDFVEPEAHVQFLFPLRKTEEEYQTLYRGFYLWSSLEAFDNINYCKFYDYAAGAFADEDFIALKYFFRRFSQPKRGYERVYPGIAPIGGTPDEVHCLRTTQISDGLATRTFYAVEVTKNIHENTTKILWHEV